MTCALTPLRENLPGLPAKQVLAEQKIEKFNKWSVVKFIFHRLVRYNEDDFPSEYQWHNNRIKYS